MSIGTFMSILSYYLHVIGLRYLHVHMLTALRQSKI